MLLKKLFFYSVIFISSHCFAQNEVDQSLSFKKTYSSEIDLTVNYMDGTEIKTRTAKAGLKYKYIKTENNNIYIKFISIKPKTDIYKDDPKYVNSKNDEIKYFVPQSELKTIHKKKNSGPIAGTLLAPIKIRPEQEINGETLYWELSTDISLGKYIGYRWALSKTNSYFLTIPTFTLGTSLLSINNSNTEDETSTSTTLGLTWSTGIILDLNGFNIGLLIGKDYAPGSAGNNWIYNEELWYSIGFGINLTSKNRDL